MEMIELIKPEQVVSLRAGTKTQLLQELARRAAKMLGLDVQLVLDPVFAREALGSTGIGGGVAVPHAKIAGLEHPFGLFARLEKPVSFDAVDGQPVDLIFLLLNPADTDKDHLTALACVSRRLRVADLARQLRAQSQPAALYNLLAAAAVPNAGPKAVGGTI